MTHTPPSLRQEVIDMCAEFGRDPLLVQGAGGNVSWKEDGTLWVKASGTWLADAQEKDIFVPVDLTDLREHLQRGDFNLTPKLLPTATTALKPSIETILHGLMPQKVVIHLHAVEVLSTLVRAKAESAIRELMPSTLQWFVVPYLKPGADLAEAVHQGLQRVPDAGVVFLKNHGVVIGGKTVEQVIDMLNMLTTLFKQSVKDSNYLALDNNEQVDLARLAGYGLLTDPFIAKLALDPEIYNRLDHDWVLYPDHVVFLGPQACVVENWASAQQYAENQGTWPELIFVKKTGVFVQSGFSKAKREQLGCYGHVMARQNPRDILEPLNVDQIGALLNWDAERYRISLAK